MRTWDLTSGVTVGRAYSAPHLPDKTVHMTGVFGCTVVIQGSNSSAASTASWVGLNDSRGEGNAISMTAPNAVTILENTKWIRPVVTIATGAATTAVRVMVMSQSTKR
jgi:hypothetical protein